MEQGEIILYQPDEAVKLEVRLEDETVWLTQEQIADLFGTKRPAITKHLNNIYKSGELDVDSKRTEINFSLLIMCLRRCIIGYYFFVAKVRRENEL